MNQRDAILSSTALITYQNTFEAHHYPQEAQGVWQTQVKPRSPAQIPSGQSTQLIPVAPPAIGVAARLAPDTELVPCATVLALSKSHEV
jgi:hypothetical protein